MSFPIEPVWKLNITSEDIVYPFVDGMVRKYRKKTIELIQEDGTTDSFSAVFEIDISAQGQRIERCLDNTEFSVAEFEMLKDFSDNGYREEVRSFVRNTRRVVARVEDLENSPAIAVNVESDETDDVEGNYRTIEAAYQILDQMKLTATQRRRFFLQIKGLSERQIAKQEGVSAMSVCESLKGVEKKKNKYFQKNPLKHPYNTTEN